MAWSEPGELEFPLQVFLGDLDVPQRHMGRAMAQISSMPAG